MVELTPGVFENVSITIPNKKLHNNMPHLG